MTNIVWVVEDLGTTGGAVWSYALGARWAAAGCGVTVFHLIGRLEEAALRPPSELGVAGGPRRRRRRWTEGRRRAGSRGPAGGRWGEAWRRKRARIPGPGVVVRLAGAVARADVVVVPTIGKAAVLGVVLARLTGTRVVAYSQGLIDESAVLYQRSRLLRLANGFCMRRVDAMLAVTPESIRAARDFGVPAERLAEVRTGIDPDDVRARAALAGAPALPAAGGRSIVAVGTLEPRKGQERILDALATLRERGCVVHLTLAGRDGGTRAALEERARVLGVEDLVSFTGFVANPAPLIAQADLLVHAAHSEIVGLVLLEALAVGTPVVAHDCPAGGPALVLDGGRLGTLVDAGSPDLLAKAICAALDGAGDRRARIEAAEPHLRGEFSPEGAGAAGLEYLRRVIARRPLHDR